MKLARTFTLASLGATSLAALLIAQGCSSSSSPETGSNDAGHDAKSNPTPEAGKGDTGTKPTVDAGKDTGASTGTGLPPKPGGKKTAATTPHNFAIHDLYLGDSDPDSTFTNNITNPWASFGYNIDGLVTTAQSTDVCAPYTNGVTAQQVDGNNGIDNAFGSQITTLINQILPSVSSTVSGKIASGAFTIEVDTVGLDGTATQTATGLTGQLFAGSTYDGTPALTGTSFSLSDNWPINGSLLNDPTSIASGSTVQFANAYVTDGTWVSGSPVTIALNLQLSGVSLSLQIHSAVITFAAAEDSSNQFHATKGIISGVLQTSELIGAINQLAANLGFCSEISIALPTILNSSDIIIGSNGTVSNTAGAACNGISIGLAFDGDEIAQPSTIAVPGDAGASVPPCGSDAGSTPTVDAGTDAQAP